MGIESYVLNVKFSEKISKEKIENILNKLRFNRIKSVIVDSVEIHNYEQINKKSIIEAQAIFNKAPSKNNLKNFFVRICFGNPDSVVEDLYIFFKKVSTEEDFGLQEYHSDKIIALSNWNEIKKDILTRKKIFDSIYGGINKPIRCDDAWNYIRRNKK